MTEKIKVTIDRSKWRTGGIYDSATGRGATKLLNNEGYMCCLGFCCKAAGCSDEDIMNVISPAGVYRLNFGGSSLRDSRFDCNAMKINDSNLTREVKEQRLLELFKDSSFEIEFTGEYTDFGKGIKC
jgi:hypothetical protein